MPPSSSRTSSPRADGTRADDTRAGRTGLAGLALSMLTASLGVSIANVALPTLAQALDVPFQAVQWVVLAYLLAVTVAIVGAGRLGDAFGRRRVLSAGLVLFALASAASALAPSFDLLIAGRALQGLGAAVLMALTLALVRETVAAERTGAAMGLLGTTSAIGTALGPSMGGLLIAAAGWRAVFIVLVPAALAALLLIRRGLPATPSPGPAAPAAPRPGLDLPGTLVLAVSLGAYALAMTRPHGLDTMAFILLAIAALGVTIFLGVERRARAPLIRPAALCEPLLAAALICNLLIATVIMTTLVVAPFYLSHTLGLDTARVGLVMSVGPVLSALTGLPLGRLVDRGDAGLMAIAGLAAMATGAALLAVLPGWFGLPGYLAGILVLTPGYQLFQAANNTQVMATVPADRRGVTSGMLGLARNLGLVTGAAVMGAVFAAAAGGNVTTAGADAVARGLRVTFATAALLMLAGIVIALVGRRMAGRMIAGQSAAVRSRRDRS
ncbi:MFS transporter [Tistrella mobilis]|uniref:MFS transporter n=1 Tax=Tistrella mobilis TaxID=171437 RepID=A0A162LIS7_9PROT|nr:MFS transporter [Tistrella mobilis]